MISIASKIAGISILSTFFFLVLYCVIVTDWVEFVSENVNVVANLVPLVLFLSSVYVGYRIGTDIITVCDHLIEAVKAYKGRKLQ